MSYRRVEQNAKHKSTCTLTHCASCMLKHRPTGPAGGVIAERVAAVLGEYLAAAHGGAAALPGPQQPLMEAGLDSLDLLKVCARPAITPEQLHQGDGMSDPWLSSPGGRALS